MSRLAVQAAGTEAKMTWESALGDAQVAYVEYSRVDPSIKYEIRPTGSLLPELRMAEAKLLTSLLTVFPEDLRSLVLHRQTLNLADMLLWP